MSGQLPPHEQREFLRSLTEEEREFLADYRKMNDAQKKAVRDFLEGRITLAEFVERVGIAQMTWPASKS